MGFPENLKRFTLLADAATAAAGSSVHLPPGKKQFQVTQSTSTATCTTKVQCSVDNSNWVDVYTQTVSAATGNNIFEVDSDVPFWRGNVTAGSANYNVDVVAAVYAD